eukprot:SAG11_NODE_4591_length_1840_cov_2.064331_1_plen_189_part_00
MMHTAMPAAAVAGNAAAGGGGARTVLITGASGSIGAALTAELSVPTSTGDRHHLVLVSRTPPVDINLNNPAVTFLQADFAQLSGADLDALPRQIDVCVHLAALTSPGNGTEAQLEVNLVGTHALLRQLSGRKGCKRFVLASSIAAVGCLCPEFRPERLPLPDEHSCQDSAGYGASKWLMEGLMHHLSR